MVGDRDLMRAAYRGVSTLLDALPKSGKAEGAVLSPVHMMGTALLGGFALMMM